VSAKPEAADAGKAPAKSKKLLIIVVVALLVVILAGVAAFVVISKQRAAADEEGGEAPAPKAVSHAAPKTPPAYLPLDSMVVNLADPGGERVAQIGIILEVADAHAVDTVKAYLPSIRSGILLLVSQKTAEELLKPEGKEKLAADILREAAVPFGGGDDESEDEAPAKKRKKRVVHVEYPVIGVLFSSFIVQ
jgi:flagellar FliL protein